VRGIREKEKSFIKLTSSKNREKVVWLDMLVLLLSRGKENEWRGVYHKTFNNCNYFSTVVS